MQASTENQTQGNPVDPSRGTFIALSPPSAADSSRSIRRTKLHQNRTASLRSSCCLRRHLRDTVVALDFGARGPRALPQHRAGQHVKHRGASDDYRPYFRHRGRSERHRKLNLEDCARPTRTLRSQIQRQLPQLFSLVNRTPQSPPPPIQRSTAE